MCRILLKLDLAWVPRGDNPAADGIFKFFDRDDWGVSMGILNCIDSLWSMYSGLFWKTI